MEKTVPKLLKMTAGPKIQLRDLLNHIKRTWMKADNFSCFLFLRSITTRKAIHSIQKRPLLLNNSLLQRFRTFDLYVQQRKYLRQRLAFKHFEKGLIIQFLFHNIELTTKIYCLRWQCAIRKKYVIGAVCKMTSIPCPTYFNELDTFHKGICYKGFL